MRSVIISAMEWIFLGEGVGCRHMQIKRISPKSLGKVLGLLYAILGFIFGAVMSVISVATTGFEGAGMMFGVGAIVFIPIVYGLGGFVGGYITAWIYNFAAKRVGGIEIETE